MAIPVYLILLGAVLLLTSNMSNALRSKVTGPFGPPYPITAAWFQDKYTKTEWNKSLSEFAAIGGDTVMLRAPPLLLATEDQLLQDPEFQWCGDYNGNEFRTVNCIEDAKRDLQAFNISVTSFATFKYEEDFNMSTIIQCPQYDKRIVTSRVYYRLVLPLSGKQLSNPCDLNNSSVIVLFTTFADIDPHQLLLESAFDRNMSVFFGLPHPFTTYEQGFPKLEPSLLPPYIEFVRRVILDHKFRYSHPYEHGINHSTIPQDDNLYRIIKGYYVGDISTLDDTLKNNLTAIYYKPVVEMVHNVKKLLAVGVSVQMNKFEKNSTVEENVKGFEELAETGVDVVSVDEGRGYGRGGYFWPTQLATPIAIVDRVLDESLHYQYPSMKLNITFEEVFWTSIQEMFSALGSARDALVKAGSKVDLWLSIDAFEYSRDEPCLPVDKSGSGFAQMLDRVTKSRVDWALTAASWNVQKVASLAWDPCFTCKTATYTSPLASQIKNDMSRPIVARCSFHSEANQSVVVIGYNLEGETQGFTMNWPDEDGKRHISHVNGYYFELDWGLRHQRLPSLEYTQLYDPYYGTPLRSNGWVSVSAAGSYHSCSFTYDFRDTPLI